MPPRMLQAIAQMTAVITVPSIVARGMVRPGSRTLPAGIVAVSAFADTGTNVSATAGHAGSRSARQSRTIAARRTSAKLACLVADGKLNEGQIWRQESIVGSVFEGTVLVRDNVVHPRIKGSAFITAEADLIIDECDPFAVGIR